MLDTLITSKTRIKLLVKFFLNPKMKGYLRGLEQEFDEGSNAIRLELNRFEEAGLLKTSSNGNKKYFQANQAHPLFNDLNSITRKYLGIDKIVEWIAEQAGNLEAVYLAGKLAGGLESHLIDLVVVGDNINEEFIKNFAAKGEALVQKKIRWVIYTPHHFQKNRGEFEQLFMIWEKD